MKNTGQDSEDLFVARMESTYGKSCYVQKFTDTKMIKGANGKKGFAPAGPSDFIVTVMGEMFYAEVKSTVDKVSFSLSQLTDSQKIALRKQDVAGGYYFVFIHAMALDKWYKIEGVELLRLASSAKKKSLKWTDLGAYEWKM